MTIKERIQQINSLTQDECWYITKQPLKFNELCFAAKILEDFLLQSTEPNYETFFVKLAPTYGISPNHRMTNNCYYVGLLNNNGQYKDATVSDAYLAIKSRCNGDFNRTDLYEDLIVSQIEKVFISNPVDREQNGLRINFKIHPAYFLAKVIITLSEQTNDYSISLSEFYRFVGSSYNYYYYLSTVDLILESRDNGGDYYNDLQNISTDNFSGNRIHLLLANLPYFELTGSTISLKPAFKNELKQKLVNYECNIIDEYFTTSYLNSYNLIPLKTNKGNSSIPKKGNFELNSFQLKAGEAGLIFSNQLIQRFVASLCTKPFVICSGLSGSGKTKLAQAFAQWICYKEEDGEKNEQYCIVPVGADWTNREPLLGYPNALAKEEYVTPENGVLDLIIRAKKEYDIYESSEKKIIPKPFFLILDEMNLSHVERYFADFLSTMESGAQIPLHKIETETKAIPQSINLPKNLFIIGTVNIDETTYMFSPKVLDRANTIEFRLTEKDLGDFIESDIKLDMNLLTSQGSNMTESFMNLALQETHKNLKQNEEDLKLFFSELKKSGAEFGYRTASEIGRLMKMLELLGEKGENLLDIAIMQKLLPKLHGSRNKLTKVLPILGGFCLIDNSKIKDDYLDKFVSNSLTEESLKTDKNIKYKISFEKICRMYKNAVENGFASYAEA